MIELDFDKLGGLLPAVLQDADSDAVLMLGFMDREAFAATLRTGRATFFSRSRLRLWTKGETSGNVAEVVSISADCDSDTLLLCTVLDRLSVQRSTTSHRSDSRKLCADAER